MTRKRRISLSSVLLDLALMGAGAILYLAFAPDPSRLAVLPENLVTLAGGLENVVRIVAGLPFVVGLFSLLGTLGRALRRK